MFGCGPQEQSTPNQLSTNKSESAASETHGSSAIVGRVLFKGSAPAAKLIRMQQKPACVQNGSEPIYSEEMVLNPDPDISLKNSEGKSGLANVFVYIKEGLSQQSYAAPTEPVILDQHHCRYVPHVFGIQVGQTLKILNSDPTFHNVHAAAKKNKAFNLGMSKAERVKTRAFDHVEVMISIRCNVHPWMSAYAGVLDHPFYEVSDSTGGYQIKALPAGEYKIAAWHELFGALEQNLTLIKAETKTMDFIFTRR